jgi:hypothetical protein
MTINHPLATDYATEQPPARMVAGALAHLATHMSTGCPRAAMLAAMLLERVATDPDADSHLRSHARELVDNTRSDGVLHLDQDESPGLTVRTVQLQHSICRRPRAAERIQDQIAGTGREAQ